MSSLIITKTYSRVVLLLGLFFLASICSAKPFLWEAKHPITGDVVYLFGTIHSGNPAVNQLPPTVINTFSLSKTFLAELDLSPGNTAHIQKSVLGSGKTDLLNTLGQGRVTQVNSILKKIHPGLNVNLFTEMPLWVFVTNLSIIEEQVKYPNQPFMDAKLYNDAIKMGKTTGGLETIDEQIDVFTGLSTVELLDILDATIITIEDSFESGVSSMEVVYQAYLEGDNTAFQQLMDEQLVVDEELNRKLTDRLITTRNRIMAKRIQQNSERQPSPIFVAVGAGHYDPKTGIQVLLKEKGWHVKRLAENE